MQQQALVFLRPRQPGLEQGWGWVPSLPPLAQALEVEEVAFLPLVQALEQGPWLRLAQVLEQVWGVEEGVVVEGEEEQGPEPSLQLEQEQEGGQVWALGLEEGHLSQAVPLLSEQTALRHQDFLPFAQQHP